MRVTVHSLYDETAETFHGTPASIYAQVLEAYPFLHSGDSEHHNDLDGVLEHLESCQAFSVEIERDATNLVKSGGNLQFADNSDLDDAAAMALEMTGFRPHAHPAFDAAQFLTGKAQPSTQVIRRALYDNDSDYYAAAIQAYGLPDTEESHTALRSVVVIGNLNKAQDPDLLPAGKDIEAGASAATDTVKAIRRAFSTNRVKTAHLDGKHSQGSLIAKDDVNDRIYLLKPGANGPGPAAGVDEEGASQSRREAAFSKVAEAWGLGHFVPHADLIFIDGREYAAIRMLPFSWKNLEKKLHLDPGLERAVFEKYRRDGTLHRWAVLDAVLGNADRHGQNLMVNQDNVEVALIDHGSAFAGDSFDPAYDHNSFVPFYLRAWAGGRFNKLPLAEKLKRMPRVAPEVSGQLQEWLNGIHAADLAAILTRYGIDPTPTLARLAKLKNAATSGTVDGAVNRFWVTT
jgi:hypothetical protein